MPTMVTTLPPVVHRVQWLSLEASYSHFLCHFFSSSLASSNCKPYYVRSTCLLISFSEYLNILELSTLLRHYVYLDVKTKNKCGWACLRRFKTYTFRFKKVDFDHTTDDKAIFDEFYLVDYIYGSFSKGGDDVMNEAHLLNHFNHASLANPITPLHADNSVRDIVSPALGTIRRKNETTAVGTRPSYFHPTSTEMAVDGIEV